MTDSKKSLTGALEWSVPDFGAYARGGAQKFPIGTEYDRKTADLAGKDGEKLAGVQRD
jgi:hypothetical protein